MQSFPGVLIFYFASLCDNLTFFHSSSRQQILFLGVFNVIPSCVCGFLAESYRENLVNKEKAPHYIQNMVADLKADTTDLTFSIYYQQLWSDHLDSAVRPL